MMIPVLPRSAGTALWSIISSGFRTIFSCSSRMWMGIGFLICDCSKSSLLYLNHPSTHLIILFSLFHGHSFTYEVHLFNFLFFILFFSVSVFIRIHWFFPRGNCWRDRRRLGGGTMAWFSPIQWRKWQRRDITKESDQGDHHYVDWDALCRDSQTTWVLWSGKCNVKV